MKTKTTTETREALKIHGAIENIFLQNFDCLPLTACHYANQIMQLIQQEKQGLLENIKAKCTDKAENIEEEAWVRIYDVFQILKQNK